MLREILNKKNIIIYLSGCLTIGIVWAAIFFSHLKNNSDSPTTKQLYGKKIIVSDFKYNGNQIEFKTTAEGIGAAITTVPKINIPEYKYWKEKNNILIASYIGNIKFITKPGFEICYMRRIGQFGFGGGVGYNNGFFIKVSGMFMF